MAAYMVGFVCLHVPAVLLTVWFRGGDLLIPGLISFALSGATLAAWVANRAALSTRLAAIPGVAQVRLAEANLEDVFLHALSSSGAGHD